MSRRIRRWRDTWDSGLVRDLQGRYEEELRDLGRVEEIVIELAEAMFYRGGWEAQRPLTATGAQMTNVFVGATQLVDGAVLPPQFRYDRLDPDEIWALIGKTRCVLNNGLGDKFATRVTIKVKVGRGSTTNGTNDNNDRELNARDDIATKWSELAATVIDTERVHAIEKVLNIEEYEGITELTALLSGVTRNPLDGAHS